MWALITLAQRVNQQDQHAYGAAGPDLLPSFREPGLSALCIQVNVCVPCIAGKICDVSSMIGKQGLLS